MKDLFKSSPNEFDDNQDVTISNREQLMATAATKTDFVRSINEENLENLTQLFWYRHIKRRSVKGDFLF